MAFQVNAECGFTEYDETMPLHQAVSKNSIMTAQRVVRSKYNVNTQDSQGRTPLILAISKRRPSCLIVKLLINAGSDIHLKDSSNQSALSIFLDLVADRQKSMKVKLIELFLCKIKFSLGNDVIDSMIKRLLGHDRSLKHIVRLRDAELTKYALSRFDCDINAQGFLDRTALHLAVEKMDLENIKILIDNGADVNAIDRWNQVPLSLYSCNAEDTDENLEIIRLLMDRGSRLTQSSALEPGRFKPIFSIFRHGSKKVIQLVFQYDIDLTVMDYRSSTPVHALAENRNANVAKVLKYANYKLDACDCDKRTPLMYAMAAGNLNTVRFFIRNGAKVNHQDRIGLTPLMSIFFDSRKQRRTEIYENCVELVLQRGADLQEVFEFEATTGERIYRTIFTIIAAFKTPNIIKPILAHLAKLDVLNEPLKDVIRQQIYSCWKWKMRFDLYRRELENMKNTKVYGSLDLFDVLIDVDLKFAEKFRCHSKIIAKLTKVSEHKYPDSYVYRQLKKCIDVAIRKLKMRVVASAFVVEVCRLPSYDHIVAQKVMNYLNYDDYKKLVNVYCKCMK